MSCISSTQACIGDEEGGIAGTERGNNGSDTKCSSLTNWIDNRRILAIDLISTVSMPSILLAACPRLVELRRPREAQVT